MSWGRGAVFRVRTAVLDEKAAAAAGAGGLRPLRGPCIWLVSARPEPLLHPWYNQGAPLVQPGCTREPLYTLGAPQRCCKAIVRGLPGCFTVSLCHCATLRLCQCASVLSLCPPSLCHCGTVSLYPCALQVLEGRPGGPAGGRGTATRTCASRLSRPSRVSPHFCARRIPVCPRCTMGVQWV